MFWIIKNMKSINTCNNYNVICFVCCILFHLILFILFCSDFACVIYVGCVVNLSHRGLFFLRVLINELLILLHRLYKLILKKYRIYIIHMCIFGSLRKIPKVFFNMVMITIMTFAMSNNDNHSRCIWWLRLLNQVVAF